GEARGIRPVLPRDNRSTGALAPDPELLDGGSAEGVAGGQHHLPALVAIELGELADGRGLAAAVDSDDQDDEGSDRRVGDQGKGYRLDQPGNGAGEDLAHLGLADLLVEPVAAELLDQLGRRRRPEIGADQQVLELLQRRLVEAALGEDAGDPLAKARGG